MKLIPWRSTSSWLDPFEDLGDWRKDMNRLFDLKLRDGLSKEKMMVPAVDISDEKDRIIVKADIPGMKKEQIQVTADDGVLVIKGEKKEEKETKEKDYIRTERFNGAFERSFTLPSGVDSANIKANYKDGVLEVILPKKEDAKVKKAVVKIE